MNIGACKFYSGRTLYEIENGLVLRNGSETGRVYRGCIPDDELNDLFPSLQTGDARPDEELTLMNPYMNKDLLRTIPRINYRMIGVTPTLPVATQGGRIMGFEFWASPVIERIEQ